MVLSAADRGRIRLISVIFVVFSGLFIGNSDLDETTRRRSTVSKSTLDNSIIALDDVGDAELLYFVVIKLEIDGAFGSIDFLSTVISFLYFDTKTRYLGYE